MKLSRGVQYVLISTLFFSAMQALVKGMPKFNSFEHIFFRSIIGWCLAVGVLLKEGVSLIGKNSKLLIFRGLVGCVSMFTFFYILTHIPFGSAVAFKYLSPIFAAIFAMFMLNEQITKSQWLYFLICFIGIILLKGFDFRISLFDLFIGLLSAMAGGLLFIVIKKIGDDDHPMVILHYFMFVSAFFSLWAAIPEWVTPEWSDWGGLLLIGAVGFVAQNYFTKAIQEPDEVSYLAVLRYTEVLFALVIGYLWFDEHYTLQSFLGLALIFVGLILSFREKQKIKP
jgi:drug/metabolite transporter (DMT)-like permease